MNINEILEAVLGSNNEKIKEAENNLRSLAEKDFGKLLLDLGEILSNEGIVVGKRQLCASIIRNTITSEATIDKWRHLSDELKSAIKTNVLSCLASQINDIRKAASLAVAGIASVELPDNQWRDILSTLVFTSSHEILNFKISSIITIGYLAQEVSPSHLTENEKKDLLNAVLNVLKTETNKEVLKNATSSLQNLIIHARSNIEFDPTNKTAMLNSIYPHLKSDDIEIVKNCILCLIEITRNYYDFIEENLNELVDISKTFFFNEDENIGILIYELWSSIAEEEANRIKSNRKVYGYCDKCLEFLTSVIKFHYINRNPQREKQFPDRWNLAKSASILLTYMSQCTNQTIIDFVFELIKEHINSENSKIKDSVLMAYGAIMETVHESKIKEIIEGSLPTLISMLSDKSLDVRTTVSWVIKKICKYHCDRIQALSNSNPMLLAEFLQTLIKFLSSNKKLIINICESFNYLALGAKKNGSVGQYRTNFLSPYYEVLFNTLMNIAYLKDSISPEYNIPLYAFYALSALIDNAPADVLVFIQGFFTNFVNCLNETQQNEKFESDEYRCLYQEYLCSVISSYLCDHKITLTLEQANYLYFKIKDIFIQRKSVFDSGIIVCSSIALNIGKDFKETILPDYGHFIFHALSQCNVESICRNAISSISDLIRSLGEDFNDYIDQLLPKVFWIIENPACDKTIRSRSLIILSDMFLCMKSKVGNYIPKIKQILMDALQASESPVLADDPDIIEYYSTLRENLLENFICFLTYIKEEKKTNLLTSDIIIKLLEYVQKIIEPAFNPNKDILHKVLYIITDLCELFQSNVKKYIDIQKIDYLIKTFKNSNEDPAYEDFLLWAEEVIFAVLYNNQ